MVHLARRAALLGIPTILTVACLPRVGTDLALLPAVSAMRDDTARFTVTTVSPADVAVFAVMSRRSGWSLRPLQPEDSSGGMPGVRTFVFNRVTRTPQPPVARLPITRYIPTATCASNRTNDRVDSARFYNWGCARGLRAADDVVVFPAGGADSGRPSGYYLVVAATQPRTANQWTMLAESLGVIGTLNQVPARLGHLAFPDDRKTRWAIAIRAISPAR